MQEPLLASPAKHSGIALASSHLALAEPAAKSASPFTDQASRRHMSSQRRSFLWQQLQER
jgi:hypothetical protein